MLLIDNLITVIHVLFGYSDSVNRNIVHENVEKFIWKHHQSVERFPASCCHEEHPVQILTGFEGTSPTA
jgi:hypothetical protein